jgi:hypothetical protein
MSQTKDSVISEMCTVWARNHFYVLLDCTSEEPRTIMGALVICRTVDEEYEALVK